MSYKVKSYWYGTDTIDIGIAYDRLSIFISHANESKVKECRDFYANSENKVSAAVSILKTVSGPGFNIKGNIFKRYSNFIKTFERVLDNNCEAPSVVSLNDDVKNAIWLQQGMRCYITGQPLNIEDAEFEHLWPKKRGGNALGYENIHIVHRDVNSEKSGSVYLSKHCALAKSVF